MKRMLDRISVDPNVCFGKPCIKGTRIWVSLILDFLASGMSFDEILEEYPSLTSEDIRAAIDYGSEMSRERFVEVSISQVRSLVKYERARILRAPLVSHPRSLFLHRSSFIIHNSSFNSLTSPPGGDKESFHLYYSDDASETP